MDKKTRDASGFEHGTVAGVLREKGALRFAARSRANAGAEGIGKESYFHLPKYRIVKNARCQVRTPAERDVQKRSLIYWRLDRRCK